MIRPVLLTFLAFLLVISVPSTSLAKGNVSVGETIPHDLAFKDHTGKERSFSNLTGKKGIVLAFVRSAEWCPHCQKQLINLNKNAKKFSDAGYNVVSVSYDSVEKLGQFAKKHNIKITLLADPASASIRAFGILNEANAKGTFSYGIPHPGVYIVSKDKKVQAKFFKGDYTKRPSVDELMAEIKKLNPPPAPVYETLDNMGSDPIDPENSVIEIPEKITDPIIIPDEEAASEVTKPVVPKVADPAEKLVPTEIPTPAPQSPPDVPAIADPKGVVAPPPATTTPVPEVPAGAVQ